VLLAILALVAIDVFLIVRAYASEDHGPGIQSDHPKTQAVRAKFMARLEEMRNLSMEKDRCLSAYAGLEDVIRETDKLSHDIEGELAKTDKKVPGKLNRLRVSLSQKAATMRMLQDLAVRQYALLTELEAIEQSFNHKTLSRAEYLRERAYIMEQIAHVEQLRLGENLVDDVAHYLEGIADELAIVGNTILLKPK
jgi:hypothetical protein